MLPRFQHILAPIDFTQKNQSALEIAFEMAVHNRARVTLLHIIETFDFVDQEIDEFYSRLESSARTRLAERAARFAEAGLEVDTKIRYGRRAAEILQFVQEHHIDLIVMSSHRVDADQPAVSLGSVSYQVSILCPCPVMLVK